MNSETWPQKDRRALDAQAFQLMSETRQMVVEQEKYMSAKIDDLKSDIDLLTAKIDSLQKSVVSYMDKTPDNIVERIEIIFDDAFPSDPDTPDATPAEKRKMHRKYHAHLIRDALEAQASNRGIRDKVVGGLIEKGLYFVIAALLAYIGLKG